MGSATLPRILSRMRSPTTSRSNCAKDNKRFRVRRPFEVVVLNCCVTETKDAPLASRIYDLGKIGERAGQPVDLVDGLGVVDLSRGDIVEQLLQRRPIAGTPIRTHAPAGSRQKTGDPTNVPP